MFRCRCRSYPGTVVAEAASWTFLTNHGHVLVCIANDSEVRISEIADQVGIGERAAQGIVTDLVEGGYLTRTRVGRRNRYGVNAELPLRHPLERDHQVGELLRAVASSTPTER